MLAFRMALFAIFVTTTIYTTIVILSHGLNLLPIFFGDMATVTWPGQFNLDFLGFLLLAGFWVAWRHSFSPAGLGLGLIAVIGGMLFMAPYLLIVSFRTRGDIDKLLLGERQVDAWAETNASALSAQGEREAGDAFLDARRTNHQAGELS